MIDWFRFFFYWSHFRSGVNNRSGFFFYSFKNRGFNKYWISSFDIDIRIWFNWLWMKSISCFDIFW